MHPFLQRLFPASAYAPVLDFPFVRSDVAMLQRLAGGAPLLDGQTWDDLLLDAYAGQLARETSIFGQQELHRRLSSGHADAASIERVGMLLDDAPQAASLQRACLALRRADTEVSEVLFGAALSPAPGWSHWLWLAPLALPLMIALTLLVGWPALFGVLAACVALMAIQSRFYESAKLWERTLDSLRHLLTSHAALAWLEAPAALPLREGGGQVATLTRAIERSLLHYVPFVDTVLVEYGDWLLLKNVKRYFRTRQLVAAQLAFLRDSYTQVAQLEADLALARHLRATPVFCRASVAAPRELVLQGMLHPLLDNAAPLSFALHGKGSFISGQNGIGKSTLLRSVGLNMVSARAFGFCYASSAMLPRLAVYASMQNEDSLDGGESLYIAELRRARELLVLAEDEAPALFLIDELSTAATTM